jgi:hypothetical protein
MLPFSLSLGVLLVSQAWPVAKTSLPLEARVQVPVGYQRVKAEKGSFADWLRHLPVLKGHPSVHLFDGSLKGNQRAQLVVLDIDVGKKNLQQCADAVMRLRAEYLWSANRRPEICFRFTSGDPARWSKWSAGVRPKIKGNRVSWSRRAKANHSYTNFRKYLQTVFMYAGTYSLQKELQKPSRPSEIVAGDVFIQGGFPGHAIIVMDVVVNERGQRRFLLAQSYMPAQEIHVLLQPGQKSPWYFAKDMGTLQTPEWTFKYKDLRRFSKASCP